MATYSMTGNTYTDKTNSVDTVDASHINNLQDEVELIEATLLGTRADDLDIDGTLNANVLTSDGAITASTTITAGTGLTVTTGNLAVSAGTITASGAITAGGNLTVSGGYILSATSISIDDSSGDATPLIYGDFSTDELTINGDLEVTGEYKGIVANLIATNSFSSHEIATLTGNYDTIYGYGAGGSLTSGQYNTIFGTLAGNSLTTGDGNTLIGRRAGQNLTTESNNIFIGRDAGFRTTDSNRLIINYRDTGSAAADISQSIIYGVLNTYPGGQEIRLNVGKFGINTAPVSIPDITGSRGGNAALADLLTSLASMGLITDSTTA